MLLYYLGILLISWLIWFLGKKFDLVIIRVVAYIFLIIAFIYITYYGIIG